MHIRKLVKAGAASHTISLPIEWLKKNSLKKGDTLFITEKTGGELSISPKLSDEKPLPKEATIEIDNKEIGSIQRELTSAYVNNYGTIILAGKSLAKKSKEIRNIIQDFVALEVAEQTSERIVAKDLLNLNEISIGRTIKRMDMILRSIMQDTIKSEGADGNAYESVESRDADINRLYFLLSRLLKSALKSQPIAANFSLSNAEVLSIWYLTVNLENMGDTSKAICSILGKIKGNEAKEIKGIYSEIERLYTDVMKAYYNKDKKLADEVASKRIEVFNMCASCFEKHKKTEVAEIIENYKAFTTLVCNIARIVIDLE